MKITTCRWDGATVHVLYDGKTYAFIDSDFGLIALARRRTAQNETNPFFAVWYGNTHDYSDITAETYLAHIRRHITRMENQHIKCRCTFQPISCHTDQEYYITLGINTFCT